MATVTLLEALRVGRDSTLRYRLEAGAFAAEISTLGCTITRLEVPDRDGAIGNVVLGHRDARRYGQGREYFGAVVGRVANRIAYGRLWLGERFWQLSLNDGPHHLHGGTFGFDRHAWRLADASVHDGEAILELARLSPAGEQGYPGALQVSVRYALSAQGELSMEFLATSDDTTVINLTNHSYFNLAGEGSGDVLDHELWIDAAAFCEVAEGLIPTGVLRSVAGTPFDFRVPCRIGQRIGTDDAQLRLAGGYDHCMALRMDQVTEQGMRRGATLSDPGSGRRLELWTDQPGVQLYSGNFLDGTVIGPSGSAYACHAGVCLETQRFPDAPNQPWCRCVLLSPGERYAAKTSWRFSS